MQMDRLRHHASKEGLDLKHLEAWSFSYRLTGRQGVSEQVLAECVVDTLGKLRINGRVFLLQSEGAGEPLDAAKSSIHLVAQREAASSSVTFSDFRDSMLERCRSEKAFEIDEERFQVEPLKRLLYGANIHANFVLENGQPVKVDPVSPLRRNAFERVCEQRGISVRFPRKKSQAFSPIAGAHRRIRATA